MAGSLDFNPVELVTEELQSKQREARLRAVRGLPAVSKAIGVEETRSQLITLLEKFVGTEDEDEVLFELSKFLGDFANELGGAAYVHLVFEPLRVLASTEETVVRLNPEEQGVNLSEGGQEAGKLALATVMDLAGQEGYGAKVSAAMACAAMVRLVMRSGCGEGEEEQSRAVLKVLLKDVSQMVRRAAADELEAMCRAMASPEKFAREFAELIRDAAKDTQDIVRLSLVIQLGRIIGGMPEVGVAWSAEAERLEKVVRAVEGATTTTSTKGGGEEGGDEQGTSTTLQEENNNTNTNTTNNNGSSGEQNYWSGGSPALAVMGKAHADPSWRVREALSSAFAGYAQHCRALEKNGTTVPGGEAEAVLSIFAALLADHEIDVRVAAFGSAPEVAESFRVAFGAHDELIGALVACGAEAPEQKVRVAAATALTRLLAVLAPSKARLDGGGEHNTKENSQLSPIDVLTQAQRVLFATIESKLFVDEHVEVMLATLRELAAVVQHLDAESAGRVAALVEQTEHENWRVRRVLTLTLPAIAQQRGKDAFELELLDGYVRSFQDRICQVRASAVESLALLGALRTQPGHKDSPHIFDGDWLMEKIAKRLSELYLTMSYFLYRITIVQAFENLCSAHLGEAHMETIIVFLVEAARDDVPNVRLTAVKAIETAAKFANDRLIANFIKPIYNELSANDDDLDVRIAVKRAAALI